MTTDNRDSAPALQLPVSRIEGLGFEWPRHAIIKQYLTPADDKVDLSVTLERMRSSRAFYRKQINDAYAFKQQTGADYADFTEKFDDIVAMEHSLSQAIRYLEEIEAAVRAG
jgi:hypothetical protein